MKKILGVFKSKLFLGGMGILAIAVLIWYVGPLIAIAGQNPLSSDLSRVVTIMTVGGVYALSQFIYYLNALRTNRNMLADLANQAGFGAAGGGTPPAGAVGDSIGTSPASAAQELERRRAAEAASSEEIATLRAGFNEALNILKRARLRDKAGRGQYLYQLPWYIIIGPPGSGKTTALLNSGLRFPIASGKVRGVGGTRNCDWWFTEEAVLLDTAGRYTTQDSHETVDRAAWQGFLELLKKHRSRRPINGALVAVSLSDLMQQTEEQRTAQAAAIKHRIQELHECFSIRFPIYVLFTKADLIAGFVEFFNDLGQEERAQVWGITLPMDDSNHPEGVIDQFVAEFELLEKRLNDRLVERLQDERDPQRRNLIYTFPHQFASLKQVIDAFLKEIFQPSRYEERVLLRGVYFTSGTQEGTPIDRLISVLAHTFGLNRHSLSAFSGKGRSYFITRLLRDVVFAEAEIAGTNLKVERWRAWLQRAAYATAALLTVTVAGLWVTSYARNELYIQAVEKQRLEVAKQIAALSPDQPDPVAALPLLNAARTIPGGYEDRALSPPWLMGFGLYQGDKLGGEARLIYQRLLLRAFLPRIVLRMEDQLRQALTAGNSALLQETLKVYLMLDDPQRFDAQAVRSWLERDWQAHLPRTVTSEQRNQLSGHLAALLELAPLESPIALDSDLIQRARAVLNQTPLSQHIYERLKNQREGVPPELGLTAAAGPDTPRVFTRKSGQSLVNGVPGLYTYAGYSPFFLNTAPQLARQLADESWVWGNIPLSTAADPQRVVREVCQLYLGDFLRQWQDLLNDVQIQPFSNLEAALQILQVLSAPASPLRTLLETVARETGLDQLTLQPSPKKAGLTAEVENLLNDGKKAEFVMPPCTLDPQLIAFNQQYRNEVKGTDGAIPPFDKTSSILNDLYSHLNALYRAQSTNPDGTVPRELKNQLAAVSNQLQVEATRKPPPFNLLLNKLAEDSDALGRSPRERLNSEWQSAQIGAFFRDNLQGRYPLSRSTIQWSSPASGGTGGGPVPSNTIQWVNPDRRNLSSPLTGQGPPDATLDAFSRFFGPNGLMDGFFQKALKPYVNALPSGWTWQGPRGPEQSISPDALQAFQRAAVIRNVFFAGNSAQPVLRFQLTPLEVNGADQVLLTVEGQTLSYTAGQTARPTPVQWTGSLGQARLEFRPSGATRSETGPWAWFRLLDQAHVQPVGTNQFRITFQIGNQQAGFALQTPTEVNPFRLQELEGFQCPDQL